MTYFYVCQRRHGTVKKPFFFDWHAGITCHENWKMRSSSYVENVVWHYFETREEALAFEASASCVIPFVFIEEIAENCHSIDPSMKPVWFGDSGYNPGKTPLYVGDDLPISVDALSISHAYEKLIYFWINNQFIPRESWRICSRHCTTYRAKMLCHGLGIDTIEIINLIRMSRPSPFIEASKEKDPMWS